MGEASIKYAQMPISETWEATDDLVWIEHGDGTQVLNRRWRCRETGVSEFRPIPVHKADPDAFRPPLQSKHQEPE